MAWIPLPTKQLISHGFNSFLFVNSSLSGLNNQNYTQVGPVSSSSLEKHLVCIHQALAPEAQPTFKSKHSFSSKQHQGTFHKNEGMMQYLYSASTSTRAALLRISLGSYLRALCWTNISHIFATMPTNARERPRKY